MFPNVYITTPIYYPNGEPHLGHIYSTLVADTLARYQRLMGRSVFFLTGTDEHGVKMVKTAAERGVTPRQLADENAAIFKDLWSELHVSNDDFIRTPEDRHRAAVQAVVDKLLANGDIYLGHYAGWYDEGQEEFITETTAKEQDYKSAISGRPLVRYEEPSYFFRLTKYVGPVLAHIAAHREFIQPEHRRNEVVSKLKQDVGDLSISRATLSWGVPMPNDPKHIVFVWIDALTNYISALGYGSADESRFAQYWPADVHLIGKEIMWFHTVYWPAMLMGLGLPLPKTIFAHGWWTSEGKKMSKTLGNFIDLERIRAKIATYGEDSLRYYLLRAAPFGSDLNWSDADFTKTYVELANVVGNLLNRVLKMIGKYRDGKIPPVPQQHHHDYPHLLEQRRGLEREIAGFYQQFELHQAAGWPVELARTANGFIEQTQPFALAKDPSQSGLLDTVLNHAAQHVYCVLVALLPVLPEKARQGLAQLNVTVEGRTMAELLSRPLADGHQLGEGSPLFPKIEPAAP